MRLFFKLLSIILCITWYTNAAKAQEEFTLSVSPIKRGSTLLTVMVTIPKTMLSGIGFTITPYVTVGKKKYRFDEVRIPSATAKHQFTIDIHKILSENRNIAEIEVSFSRFNDQGVPRSSEKVIVKVEPSIALTVTRTTTAKSSSIRGKVTIPKNDSTSPISVTISYTGPGSSCVTNAPYLVFIGVNKTEADFIIPINNTSDNNQILNISASASDFKASNSLSITILGAPAILSLSVDHETVRGEDVIHGEVTIPKTCQSSLPISVTLSSIHTNSSSAKPTITPVTIKADKTKGEFTLSTNNNTGSDQVYRISANAVGFRSANSLSITVLKKPTLVLNVDSREVKGGSSISGKVTIAEVYRSVLPLTVTFAIAGSGSSFLVNPIQPVVIPPNDVEVDFDIPVKNIVGTNTSSSKPINLLAEARGAKPSETLTINLLPNVTELKKNEALTLPPLPKLKIVNGAVVVVKEKKAVRSSKELTGFWIACRLKAKCLGSDQENSISPSKVSNGIDKKNTDGILSLWIPLKNCPSRYYATAAYRDGQTYAVGYNQTETKTHSVDISYTMSSSNSDSKGNSNRKHATQTQNLDIGLETKLEVSTSIPAVGGMNGSFSRNIKEGYSSVSGIHTEESNTLAFGSVSSSTHTVRMERAVTKQGPTTYGFQRVYALFYPTITYSFGDPNGVDPIDIGQYIDYVDDNSQAQKSIENYIHYLFKPEQFYPSPGGYANRLSNYLKKYKDISKFNANLSSIASIVKNHDQKITDITIESLSVGLFYSEINYGDPANPIEVTIDQPTDCNAVEAKLHHQFILDDKNQPISSFSWDLPPSATEFQLEIKKANGSWGTQDVKIFSGERVRDNNRQPIKQTYNAPVKAYTLSTTYEARVKSKCGVGAEWSAYSNPLTFTYNPAQCSVTGITATSSDSDYVITWDPLNGATGYCVEYAEGKESFEEARARTTVFGVATHEFDRQRIGNLYYFSTANVQFRIKITPFCLTGVGTPIVKSFSQPPKQITCGPISAPFQQWVAGRPIFTLQYQGGDYEEYWIEIKKKSASWTDDELEATYIFDQAYNNQGSRKSTIFNDAVTEYDAGISYVARVKARCSNNGWTDYSTDSAPFKGPVSKEKNTRPVRNILSNPPRLLNPKLSINPNPVTDLVTFKLSNLEQPHPVSIAEIKIFKANNIRSTVEVHAERRENISTEEAVVINKNLPFGNYILVVTLDNKTKLTQHFIK